LIIARRNAKSRVPSLKAFSGQAGGKRPCLLYQCHAGAGGRFKGLTNAASSAALKRLSRAFSWPFLPKTQIEDHAALIRM